MSNPPNPLAKFNSYAYHHVLVVTDGMETVDTIINDETAFERPSNAIDVRYNPIELTNSGKYIILVDSRKDINFSINKCKWETLLAPSSKNGIRVANTIESSGSMEIHEPFGIEFLRVLAESTDSLERTPSGLVFILKTIFIGHDASTGQQEIISRIKPFAFNAIDIKAVMDEGGATYQLDFVSTANGLGKQAQISMITNGMGLKLERNITVGAALKVLEERINTRYEDRYKELAQTLSANKAVEGGDYSDGFKYLQDNYKKVRYRLEVDEPYNSAPYLVGGQASTSNDDDLGKFIIQAPPQSSITTMIDKILSSSEQMGKDAKGENASGQTYTSKIISTLVPSSDSNVQEVVYKLNRYKTTLQKHNEEIEPKAGEFIEFNYIYTGKNVDILDFNIKMDMGLSFFQTAGSAKNKSDSQRETTEGTSVLSTTDNGGEGKGVDITAGTKADSSNKKDILYLGLNVTKGAAQEHVDPTKDLSFDSLLERQAALENVSATIKIAGNPQLLSETTPFYKDILEGESSQISEEATGASDWFHVPALIKVNIKYPTNTDLAGTLENDSVVGTKDFWYRGFYNLLKIENIFSNGEFTQVIDMFSVPGDRESSAGLTPKTNETQPDEAVKKAVSKRNIQEDKEKFDGLLSEVDLDLPIIAADDPNADGYADASLLYKTGARGVQVHPYELDQTMLDIYTTITAAWALHAPNIRPVITSTYRNTTVAGSDPPRKSLHAFNKAVDVRGNNLTNVQGTLIRDILRLGLKGRGYTVLWETFSNSSNNHIHIQYDGRDLVEPDDDTPADDSR